MTVRGSSDANDITSKGHTQNNNKNAEESNNDVKIANDSTLNDEALDHSSEDAEIYYFINENSEEDDTSMQASMLSSESVNITCLKNSK